MYDVIIVGAGPAGLSAAVYCSRGRTKTLVIGDITQSRACKAKELDNYLGFPSGISGRKFVELGAAQVERFGGKIVPGEVVGIKPFDQFEVELASGSKYQAKAIILATGVSSKASGIRNEEALVGMGVSYCANCDAFFYRDRRVAIIGSANLAAKEALELLPHTRDVTIFSHGQTFEISPNLLEELQNEKVTLRDEKVVEFVGNGRLEALRLDSGELWAVDGAFLAHGTASSLDFARTLGLQIDKNHIVVDADGKTNFPGVFAAGDCAGPPLQAAKAVGQGCCAAIAAMAYVRHQRSS